MHSPDQPHPVQDNPSAVTPVPERRNGRGRLRIYFGASPGVGKTWAMLSAGRALHAQGRDLLVGVIDTHGRAEAETLLDGLAVLPPKSFAREGSTSSEFDIDAAMARHPEIILVDELAHANVPGSRHPKRWQDVEELLSSGIDVFTTVDVQHLDSLHDVVRRITGIPVSETIPDTVFDAANEVVLVDLTADELMIRYREGKVHQASQSGYDPGKFFRKGNLIALRELALRRTADRIENDVRAYRVEQSIHTVWETDAALLACVGPGPDAEHVVRGAARLASQLNAEWHAVYVETPRLQRLPPPHRERILKTLKLAQDLGATTAVLAGQDVAREIVDYAQGRNLSKILLGQGDSRWPWVPSHRKRIAAYAPDLDLTEVGRRRVDDLTSSATLTDADVPAQSAAAATSPSSKPRHWGYVWAAAACIGTTAVATPLQHYFDLANIAMLYLLAVLLIAMRFGRGPSVMAAFLNVLAFDYFFVPPRFTFAVSNLQFLVVFAVMLIVGLITGQLAAGLRFQARIASHRETRVRALYEFARELSGALQTQQIAEMTRRAMQQTFRATASVLLPDEANRLRPPFASDPLRLNILDLHVAQWAFDNAKASGMGTNTLPGSAYFFLPLIAPMRTRGVLAIKPQSRRWMLIPEQRRQLETYGTLAAIALERVHYADVAQDALVHMESERLRNSLLAALSHDLRTPLTSLVGLSESLALSRPPLAPIQQELAQALHDEALRMSNMVSNLLEMARIHSGEVKLNLQWLPFEEVVGSALRASRSMLIGHEVKTRLAHDLPLIHFDAVLIERVLCNLVENAAKYTPAGSRIVIAAQTRGANLEVTVSDNGPGLPAGQEDAIFEKFTRGMRESATPGIGLGLAICRAIVDAHGGTIRAERSEEGGASFIFMLPLGTPPALPELDEGEPLIHHRTT